MRCFRPISVLLVLFALAKSAMPQEAAPSSPQAAVLLRQSLAGLTGGRPLTDVTLSGTVRRIAGSDDESGTAVLKALAGTGTRLDLTLPGGPRTEIHNSSAAPTIGYWSGPDGVSHPVSHHNLLTDPSWAPAFTIARLLTAQNAIVTYIGTETRNSQSVIHLSASQQFPALSGEIARLMQHLAQTDVYLDAATSLPAAIAFNIHPDDNASLDIPVELRFSDYRSVDGAQIPFHIERFINNSLALDLQFQNATLNSGITASSFSL